MDMVSFREDDARATPLLNLSFLGFPLRVSMQSPNTQWPFAHVSQALHGIKADVILGVDFGKHYDTDTEHEGKARKVHTGARVLRHPANCPSTAGSRDSKRVIIEDASHNSALTGLHIKGMQTCTESCPPQMMEQTRSATARINTVATAAKCANHKMPQPPKPKVSSAFKMKSQKAHVSSNQVDNLWEYGFSTQPVPNMVSGLQSFGPKSTYFELDLVNPPVGQPSAACKLTLERLPLRGFVMQAKVMTEETTYGRVHTVERKKKVAKAVGRGQLQSVRVLKQLLCGGVAGVISRSVVAPLDLVKTYLITSHGLGGSQKSALSIFKEIVDTGGWQGLFRGNLVNCIRVAPSKAIELCIFEAIRRELNKEGHPLKNVAATIAGGAAGMAGTVATYPLELIRTRLSVQPQLYTGIFQAVSKISQEEGLMAFYAGLSPSLIGIFPYAATNYFVYDGLRATYRHSTGRQNVPTIPTLAFGAVAAAVSSTVTYPLEVARRQMQLSLGSSLRKSSVGIVLDIYSREGFLALYRGLGTTWLKLIPAAGISFVCYEAARFAMCIDDASVAMEAKEICVVADEESQI